MTLSLRQFARSPRLRALSVLAWLLLVVNAVAAAPLGMRAMPPVHAMPASVATGSAHGHHVAPVAVAAASACCADVDHADGCVDMTGQHCTCAAMCGTALAPMTVLALVPVALTTTYAVPLRSSLPALMPAPPLRPPAV
jgi:hypothetical protein